MASPQSSSPFAKLEQTNKKFDIRGKTGHPGNYGIKDIIFRYAGREGCFAYRIATGGKDIDKIYIERNAFYEPFTCWDWRDWVRHEGDERKRRLFWEREKGFKIHGWASTHYPSPIERWNQFRVRINNENRQYVKRIAVAHWMDMEDIEWISEELPALEALDLSDVQEGKGISPLTDPEGKPRWSEILDRLRHSRPDPVNTSAPPILSRLRWLGLSDCDSSEGDEGPFSTILPECTSLENLSIRAPYDKRESYDYRFKASTKKLDAKQLHDNVCCAVLRITHNVPGTVRTIELRRSIEFLPHFIKHLKASKPTIQRAGIDLGAWIQLYPFRTADEQDFINPTIPLHRDHIVENNAHAAYCQALEFSKALDSVGVASKSFESSSNETNNIDINAIQEKDLQDGALYQRSKAIFYQNTGGTYVRSERPSSENLGLPGCELGNHLHMGRAIKSQVVNTLPQFLIQLQYVANQSGITLFPLEAEPENRSTFPIHPLALIQFEDEAACGARENYLHDNRLYGLPEAYKWVNQTFGWRPVFDWDWFMVPEKMESTVDLAYRKIYAAKSDYMDRIELHFKLLQAAGIPVHLLIGKRNIEGSSCYWGSPYDQHKWNQWLNKPFSANLETIACLVDTLSIFYDLRNPIVHARLEEIEAIKSHTWSTAICPTVPCPWEGEDEASCPFLKQRQPLGHQGTGEGKQKMANKQSLQRKQPRAPVDYARLAHSSTSMPPVGENANDHESDDSDTEDSKPQESLHYLARRAVFTRETVGWQRFWAEYALKFTSLTTLHVRMPRCFDKIGSWRLARLLDQSKGWKLLTYTDERQHIHTDIDHVMHLPGHPRQTFEHASEAKIWPAGRFVRRSWVWPETRMFFRDLESERREVETSDAYPEKRRGLEAYSKASPEWGNCNLDEEDREMAIQIEYNEKKELAEAVNRAETAARRERETEAVLCPDIEALRHRVAQESLKKKKLYYRGIHYFAQRQWSHSTSSAIKYLNKTLSETAQAEEQQKIRAQIEWLQRRQREDVPILEEPGDNDLQERGDVLRDMGWVDVGPASPLDLTNFRNWAPAHWFEEIQTSKGVVDSVFTPDPSGHPGAALSHDGPAETPGKRKRSDGSNDGSSTQKKPRTDDVLTTADTTGQPIDTIVLENVTTTIITKKSTTLKPSKGKDTSKPPTTDQVIPESTTIKSTSSEFTSPRVAIPKSASPKTAGNLAPESAPKPTLKPTSTSLKTTTEAPNTTMSPSPEPRGPIPKHTPETLPEREPDTTTSVPVPKPSTTGIKRAAPRSSSKPDADESAAKKLKRDSKKAPESGYIDAPRSSSPPPPPPTDGDEDQTPTDQDTDEMKRKGNAKKQDSGIEYKPDDDDKKADDDDDDDAPPPPKKGRGRPKGSTITTTTRKKAEPKKKAAPKEKKKAAAEIVSPVARRTRLAEKKKKAEEEGGK